jgi:hypothetical protein
MAIYTITEFAFDTNRDAIQTEFTSQAEALGYSMGLSHPHHYHDGVNCYLVDGATLDRWTGERPMRKLSW